jgi:hypothetical protein
VLTEILTDAERLAGSGEDHCAYGVIGADGNEAIAQPHLAGGAERRGGQHDRGQAVTYVISVGKR